MMINRTKENKKEVSCPDTKGVHLLKVIMTALSRLGTQKNSLNQIKYIYKNCISVILFNNIRNFPPNLKIRTGCPILLFLSCCILSDTAD